MNTLIRPSARLVSAALLLFSLASCSPQRGLMGLGRRWEDRRAIQQDRRNLDQDRASHDTRQARRDERQLNRDERQLRRDRWGHIL